MRSIAAPLLLAALMATGCNADENDIRKNIEARFPGAKVVSVGKSPMSGVFEVVVQGNQIIYSDGKGDYVIAGDLLQTSDRRNLTKEKIEKLSEVKFDTLPFDQAIKTVKGDGKRQLAVFSDPDCPYCRKLEHELAKLDNVTLYTFMFPLPMHADAPRKSRLVWCAADRAMAWSDLMLSGKVPEGKDDCANPLDANLALAEKLNVSSTPTMILSNGKRVSGAIPSDRLDAMLNDAGK